MDVKQLRYFCAVFERKNLSHAAQQCFVAQSAISHHLANLESELKVKLFDRQPRGMDPTPEGARLYEHARSILRSIESASEDVQQLSSEITGSLRLGLPYTIVDAIAVDLFLRIRDAMPKADVMLQEAFSNQLFDQLVGGNLDLVFVYNAAQDERVQLSMVHYEPLCCVGHPSLVGPDPVPISMAEATSLPQMVLQRGDAARSVSNQLRMQQAMNASKMFECNSVIGVHKAIQAGLAVVICPYITVRNLANEGRVVARPIVDPAPIRRLDCARLSNRTATKLSATVSAIVTELIGKETKSGRWPIVSDPG
ncbi:LysR family transcriptional regulator [Croceicoccus marinus]|uniref:HTH lysR-type domain-containing protein n=1 Tax=Croceicoccus marinus TaxID=450378 RepID=A0A1Z1F8F3_9SPHN|nr:LysR family transcriptional regulator [Croceicoccus marinus]ARU15013.1 hypothetical protein A9D14_01015 [Croceicoccus marinus]